ncbi:hypothetical protein RRG08_063579 [Elysia crispata]|uniref:Uncharacterized protein n=1 Tax=Elysia crispata TaxID=231223 RepID=A0AAE0YRN1_9GAST|nr:hypothetical protein RRG08_063579 [Elysia crispata]
MSAVAFKSEMKHFIRPFFHKNLDLYGHDGRCLWPSNRTSRGAVGHICGGPLIAEGLVRGCENVKRVLLVTQVALPVGPGTQPASLV